MAPSEMKDTIMATVFRKTYTQPMPKDAEIVTRRGKRVATWIDRKGKRQIREITTKKNGEVCLCRKTATYLAQYRDGEGRLITRTTGCRDHSAAMALLNSWLARAEKVRANIITPVEDAMIDHQYVPLVEHMEAWLEHLENTAVTLGRIKTNRQRFSRMIDDCCWRCLADLKTEDLERWMAEKKKRGMSAGARNGYREACVGFGNWCIRTKRLKENPFARVVKADQKVDCRRKRRALTEDELNRLLAAAGNRPLCEAMTVRRGKNKGKLTAAVSPAVKEKLKRLGQERALIYKTFVLTGLRLNELRSITVSQVCLDEPLPHLVLNAADEKNRRGANIPLRADLAEEVHDWLDQKLHLRQVNAQRRGEAPLDKLPEDEKLFMVSQSLLKVLDKDLAFAGIAKRDARGRTVDVHALRHTFGTHLARACVIPRVAQAAMRHSSLDLTMNVYTDPALLDVAGVLDKLPALVEHRKKLTQSHKTLPPDGKQGPENFTPDLPHPPVHYGQSEAKTGKTGGENQEKKDWATAGKMGHKSRSDVEKGRLSTRDNRLSQSEREDLNFRPLRPERSALPS